MVTEQEKGLIVLAQSRCVSQLSTEWFVSHTSHCVAGGVRSYSVSGHTCTVLMDKPNGFMIIAFENIFWGRSKQSVHLSILSVCHLIYRSMLSSMILSLYHSVWLCLYSFTELYRLVQFHHYHSVQITPSIVLCLY